MSEIRTHYDNLKVSEQASTEELRAAFKYRFEKFHPNSHPGNRQRALGYLQILKESYAILSDPLKRGIYDSWIEEQRSEEKKDSIQDIETELNGNEAQAAIESDSPPVAGTPLGTERIKTENRLYSWVYPISFLVLAAVVYLGWVYLARNEYPGLTSLENIDETTPGYQFNFENRCHSPVTLAIRYWGLDDDWHMAGWWDVDPGSSVYLEDSDGNRLISNNAVWFYYVRTVDETRIEWAGKNLFIFDGAMLRMVEVSDTVGDSEWSISCDSDSETPTRGSAPGEPAEASGT